MDDFIPSIPVDVTDCQAGMGYVEILHHEKGGCRRLSRRGNGYIQIFDKLVKSDLLRWRTIFAENNSEKRPHCHFER